MIVGAGVVAGPKTNQIINDLAWNTNNAMCSAVQTHFIPKLFRFFLLRAEEDKL